MTEYMNVRNSAQTTRLAHPCDFIGLSELGMVSCYAIVTHRASQCAGALRSQAGQAASGSAQDASSVCPERPPAQGTQSPEGGDSGELPEPGPIHHKSPPSPSTRQSRPVGPEQEEIRRSVPTGANPSGLGPLWVLQTGPMPQHTLASANVVRVAQ